MPRKRIEDIISSRRKEVIATPNIFQDNRRKISLKSSGKEEKQDEGRGFLGGGMPRVSFESADGGRRRRYGRFTIWYVAALALVLFFVAFSTIFGGATLKIVPNQKTMELDQQFTASRGEAAAGLPFEVMKSTGTETKTVRATEVKQVDRKASGTIIIYNNFNSSSQRLIKNTRFETPDGLIYRIRDSITIPGQVKEGGEVVPGSVEALVYADMPGDKYNIGLTDFTIPGFKGTVRFSEFYARSKTPMAGGFSGIVKTVSQQELENIQNELRTAITQKLLTDAHSQKPDNFVLFENAILVKFNEQEAAEQQNVDESMVSVMERGTLYAAIFNSDKLSAYVGKTLIPTLSPEENIKISNAEDIIFEFEDKDLIDLSLDQKFSFRLRGNAHLVWTFDKEKLIKDIVGKPKVELTSILAQFPSITRAEVILRPFWKNTFPENSDDIKVEVVLDGSNI